MKNTTLKQNLLKENSFLDWHFLLWVALCPPTKSKLLVVMWKAPCELCCFEGTWWLFCLMQAPFLTEIIIIIFAWLDLHLPLLGTVLLKGKLTVLTRNSILDPQSFRESRIEFRGSSFENWVSRIKNQGSSFETLEEFFEDLEQRFRRNDLILENKTIAMNKTIDARLCSRKPALNVCKYSFVLCIFYKAHAARISTLKLITRRQQTKIPAIYAFIALPAGVSEFFILCTTTTRSKCVVLICTTSTGRQNVNKR